MKMLSIAVLASSALLAAMPVAAQSYDSYRGGSNYGDANDRGWNNGGAQYGRFGDEFRMIARQIERGARNGSLNNRQVAGATNELNYIRTLARQQRERGAYNPRIIQARLSRLNETLRVRSDIGNDRRDRYDAANYRNDRDRADYAYRERDDRRDYDRSDRDRDDR